MTLIDDVNDRLPWSAAGVVWTAAERHGLTLKVDDDLEDRCLALLAGHLLMCAGFDEQDRSVEADDRARLLLGAMGDGFPYWAVMVGESFISHLVTRRESLTAYPFWVAA